MSTDDRRRAIDRQTEMNERLLERVTETEPSLETPRRDDRKGGDRDPGM
jgi:hypothetical protein